MPLRIHPLAAALPLAVSMVLAWRGRARSAGALLAAALIVLGSGHRPERDQADLLTGPIYNGTILSVTPRGAVVDVCGARLWAGCKELAGSTLRGDRVTLIARRQGRFLDVSCHAVQRSTSFFARQSRALAAILNDRIRSPRARALAQALVLGTRAELPYGIRELVRETGTVHLLALSGLHVGLFAAAAYGLARLLLGRGWPSSMFALSAMWAYVLLAGARTPTLRAGLMVSAFMAHNLLWGRKLDALSAWGLALFVVLLLMPESAYDMGAMMSFGAVLSLLVLGFKTPRGGGPLQYLVSGLAAGVVVTVGIAPLVSSAYGEVKLLGPAFTVLSIPPMLLLMALAVLSLLPLVGAAAALGVEWVAWAWLKMLQAGGSPSVSVNSMIGYALWLASLVVLWLVGRRAGALGGLRYCLARRRRRSRTAL
jgi:ComEC/Rec2-related protein